MFKVDVEDKFTWYFANEIQKFLTFRIDFTRIRKFILIRLFLIERKKYPERNKCFIFLFFSVRICKYSINLHVFKMKCLLFRRRHHDGIITVLYCFSTHQSHSKGGGDRSRRDRSGFRRNKFVIILYCLSVLYFPARRTFRNDIVICD